jgi:hypothetical protein
MNATRTVPESPSTLRQKKIEAITIGSDNSTILAAITNPEILRDLQEDIVKNNTGYLGIIYLLMQYISGEEVIHTRIPDGYNPGSFTSIGIHESLVKEIENDADKISHAILRLRNLYQTTMAFERTKILGDMIHRKGSEVSKEVREQVLALT